MPTFSTEVPHQLGTTQATERLKQFIEHTREQYKDLVSDLEGDWNDSRLTFSFKAYGLKISGTLAVDETAARLSGHLPFAALAFRGKIEQSIESVLRRELAS
jgi:DNA-binding transcriptional regulator GbsR (MarR family)